MGSFVYILFGSAKDLTIGPTAIMCMMTGQYTVFGGATYAVLLSLFSGILQLVLDLPIILYGGTTPRCKTLFHIASRWTDTILGISCIIVLLTMRYFRDARLAESSFGLSRASLRAVNGAWWTIVTARNVLVVLFCGGMAAILDAQDRHPFSLTGNVQGGLPEFRVPNFTYTYHDSGTNTTVTKYFGEIISDLHVGAVVISLLSILESVAIAKAFAKGKRVNATQEMFALGCCNIAGSFVQAFPATGSFSRTAINNASGVRTPMGGLFTGGIVLAALAFLSPYFSYIPKATLASIIITSVIFMVHVEDVRVMWRTSKSDLIPFSFTFFGSFFFGLEYGIMMGVVIAILLLLHHNARPTVTVSSVKACGTSSYVSCRIDRSILFPSALYVTGKIGRRLREEVQKCREKNTLVVIDGSHLPHVDYTTCVVRLNRTLKVGLCSQPIPHATSDSVVLAFLSN
ncbi:sodium-independent sulfate anion transporter-like [Tropilaelaps mercedesae]|uniref:Sodium-independent sulfate anion transporter-like n=1 Tax=Tropilaelaps mercedesae TaxID=418985 RepID=A0A1V9XEL2_9ACAR|nr:sodium-independent sulfate anion transporter-like [Tropilaelaps mercedesae]